MSEDEKEKNSSIGKALVAGAASGALGALAGDAGAVALAAGLGALAGGAEHLMDLAAQNLRSPADRRLFEAQERLAAEALESVREPIQEKVERLKDVVGEHEASASVVPTLRHWSDAWFAAEGKKRRVIMAALVSAFDPESYEAALTHRFFRLLKEVDYSEIRLLCESVRLARKGGKALSFSVQSIDEHCTPGDERTTLRARLNDLGLMRSNRDSRAWTLTWLGVEFVSFLERGGFSATGEAKV